MTILNINTAIDDRGVLTVQKSDFIKEKHLQHRGEVFLITVHK